ncbi:Rha family transcriptional regulator [Acinetobacter johnsonii]|uniref:Rha family transcriptional regulator n=1 Tax=Acinetobacter johnsonii TaxID=40214 RepID=UPI0021673658|nr:Rha family transcriptional regulator [Acinetobacter johnsonii]MCS3528390.1 Rha family phage regulatory protein [Acinetobacter johnsonii]
MNALDFRQVVFIQDQQIKTDSLKVAKAFGRRHTNVLRAIETLDCAKSFNALNFELVKYIDAKGESRPMYEMTKDGWMFLVMGFTGEKAAQIKIAFINAFNAMATLLQNQQLIEQQGIQVGTKVRLNSGSPELTVNQLITNAEGILDQIEVIWFSNRLYKTTLSIHAVVPVLVRNKAVLQHFWEAIYQYGLHLLNHSHKPDQIALNLPQVCVAMYGLPDSKALIQELTTSTHPYPHYLMHGHAVRSVIDDKTYRCIVFKQTAVQLGGAA